MKWNKKQAELWTLHWVPPSRLSDSELKVFESIIKKYNKNSKILILGSTIELRELCHKYGITPYIVDYKKEVYTEWSKLLRIKGKECFINKNWLNMNFDFKFDLILGELAFTMLLWNDQIKFSRILANMLKKDGISLQRIWVRSIKNKNITKMINDAKLNAQRYNISMKSAIFMDMINYYYDEKNDFISGPPALKKLNNDFKKGIIPKEIYDLFAPMWKVYKNSNHFPKKEKLDSMLKKHFKIKITYGKDFYRKMCPLYILTKK
jgi:hypothetical protein